MRFIKTSHYRSVNAVVVLVLLAALFNARAFEPGFLPQYKLHLLNGSLLMAVLCLIFVRPTPDLGPLKVPNLSQLQIRLASGVLLVFCVLSLANYYVLNPGFFAPYKKQVLVASFVLLGAFVLLYAPMIDTSTKREKEEGPS